MRKYYVTQCLEVTAGADLVIVDISDRYAKVLLDRISKVEGSDDLDEFARFYRDQAALYINSAPRPIDLNQEESMYGMELGKSLVTRGAGLLNEDQVDVDDLEGAIIPVSQDTSMIQVSEHGVQWMACPESDTDLTMKSHPIPIKTLEGMVEDSDE